MNVSVFSYAHIYNKGMLWNTFSLDHEEFGETKFQQAPLICQQIQHT